MNIAVSVFNYRLECSLYILGVLLSRTSFPVIVHFYYCEISQSYKPIKNNTLNLQCHLKSIYLSGLFPYTLIETLPAIPSERVLLLSFLFVR